MSGKLVGQVYERQLPRPEQSILVAMADHADDFGNHCFPSVPFLAWKADYSRRQVQRVMASLRALGVLALVRPATQHKPAEYRIVLDALPMKPAFRGDTLAPQPESRGDAGVAPGVTPASPRGDIAMAPEPSITAIEPKTPPTPTPIIPDPPTADHATATAAATGGGHKPPAKPKPATPPPPPALFVLPPADPPPPRVDPWEALYAAAALDLEGKATAWRHHRTGRALAGYGELASAIGPHVADDPEAAVEVWRAIVAAKKAETFADGRPVWSIFSPSNAARLCRRHLQDHPGFAALAVRTMAQAADTRPPIGRIASQRGFTVSRPDTWPADVLAAYPDIAAQWAGTATGTDGADLTQATDKRYTLA